MLAVDTNILVRYLVIGDDPDQAAKARKLIVEQQTFFPITVLLETEWVLRSKYRLKHEHIMAAILALAGVPSVTLQSRDAVVRALRWASSGTDFADALHLALSGGANAFMTFDRDFARRSRAFNDMDVRLL